MFEKKLHRKGITSKSPAAESPGIIAKDKITI